MERKSLLGRASCEYDCSTPRPTGILNWVYLLLGVLAADKTSKYFEHSLILWGRADVGLLFREHSSAQGTRGPGVYRVFESIKG